VRWQRCELPEPWKRRLIIPICKEGGKTDCETVEVLVSLMQVRVHRDNKLLKILSRYLIMEEGHIKGRSCVVNVFAMKYHNIKKRVRLGDTHSYYRFCKSI
jgi:hypothetical protein